MIFLPLSVYRSYFTMSLDYPGTRVTQCGISVSKYLITLVIHVKIEDSENDIIHVTLKHILNEIKVKNTF